MSVRICLNCNLKFVPRLNGTRESKAKYCSKECADWARGAKTRLPETACKVKGCDFFGKALVGFCPKHYQYWHNHGIPEPLEYSPSALDVTEAERMWLAGIVDCDGWIGLLRGKRQKSYAYWAVVGIGNTNKKFIDRVHAVIEIGRVNLSKRHPPAKDLYQLTVNKYEDVRNLLVTILPHLIIKKKQAELLLTMPPKNAKAPEQKAEIKRQMTILNKKGC